MILLAHILIALASIAFTTFVFFKPSKVRLRGSYALIALTIISGTALALSAPGHMLETCVMGLLYTAGTSVAMAAARKKLLAQTHSE